MIRKCVLGSLAVAALLCTAFENQAEARRCRRRSRSDCCYGQSYASRGGHYGNGSYGNSGYSSQRCGYMDQCCSPSGAGTTATNYPPAAGSYPPDGTYRDGTYREDELAPRPSDAPPPPAADESRNQDRSTEARDRNGVDRRVPASPPPAAPEAPTPAIPE